MSISSGWGISADLTPIVLVILSLLAFSILTFILMQEANEMLSLVTAVGLMVTNFLKSKSSGIGLGTLAVGRIVLDGSEGC